MQILVNLIKDIAPTLASSLLGPIAGQAVNLIKDAFSGNENDAAKIVVNVLSDPEFKTKLIELENKFKSIV